MNIADFGDIKLHYQIDGDPNGAPIVFANSLGTDLRVWDLVVPHLPKGLKIVRFDKRGHGLSSAPDAPYAMGTLVKDVERLLDHLELKDVLFVGLSIGGLIAQGLSAKRLDLVRAVVLSNTAAKIGTRDMWQARIDAIREGGIEVVADQTMERWFAKPFRDTHALHAWRSMMVRQPVEGYIGCCEAIAGTDMLTPTSGLRLPALGIAGSEDGSTPPDLVRETINLIPGADLKLIRNTGHIPCVEAPEAYAKILTEFIDKIGHLHG